MEMAVGANEMPGKHTEKMIVPSVPLKSAAASKPKHSFEEGIRLKRTLDYP